jgi:hypothetical protein
MCPSVLSFLHAIKKQIFPTSLLQMKLRLVLLLSFFTLGADVSAQGLSDGVRLMRDPLPVGSRSTGMNNSLIAGANDYSALALNPAALAPISFREFGITLFHRASESQASFLGNTSNATLGNTELGTLGFAFAVPAKRGHLAFGISYDRVLDYSNRYSFSAVNPNSSFLNTRGFIADPKNRLSGESIEDYKDYLWENNLAFFTYLTNDIDSANDVLTSRLTGDLEEAGTVTEEGGLNALRIGGGVDIAEGVAVGATLNVLFGSYDYRRVLTETDVNGIFADETGNAPNGFQSAVITDTRVQDQTGINLKLGLLAYPLEFVRFGLTVETPTWYGVEDAFYRQARSNFRSGESFSSEPQHETVTVNDYTVVTPFKLGAGIAFNAFSTTLSGSVQYYDPTELRFENEDADLQDLSNRAVQDFEKVLSWSIGVEHVIPLIGVAVRGGFGIEPSPYRMDVESDYDIKTLSAGASILLSKSTALELAYRRVSFTTDHVIYNDRTPNGQQVSANIDRNDIKRSEFSLSFGYRF